MADDESVAEGIDTVAATRGAGTWGEVISVEETNYPVEVLGLLPPDAPEAKASVSFTYGMSGGGGLKLDVGIASFGISAKYSIDDSLKIVGKAGEASVASLLIPVEVTTQQFRPEGAAEWFEAKRYRLVRLSAARPSLGGLTNIVSPADLLKRKDASPITIGGGTAPTIKESSAELELNVEASLKLPLAVDPTGKPTDTATLSATLSGTVSAESSCEIPANLTYNLYWLRWLAGACYVRA
jgi:hypothetical protein